MRNFLLFFSLTLLLGACELFPEAEPENTLPPITQEGANTFGCKVNGEVWLPYKNGGFFDGDALEWELGHNSIYIDPENDKADFQRIILALRPKEQIEEGKTYYFYYGEPRHYSQDSIRAYEIWGGGVTNHSSCDYGVFLDSLNVSEGWIKITKYDPLARETNTGIVAGEFEYIAYSNREPYAYCDTVAPTMHVTEGRFDILTIKR